MEFPGISVFGLGYVGSVTAACLAERGCSIVGCDVAEAKVRQIASGAAPISEPGLDELLTQQCEEGKISATTDARDAVLNSEVSIVCVGTPSLPSGAIDLQYVEMVASQISEAIREKGTPHTVVFRSTMLPGSTRDLCAKYFSGIEVHVYFFPEFLRQGSALADFRSPSLSVIGKLGEKPDPEWLPALIEKETEFVSAEEAELLKYGCNAFHATKVAFANEIGRMGKALGVDSRKVMSTLCEDTRLNISKYYMRPGNPFGGSCLPKDVKALNQQARRLGVNVPLLGNLIDSNRQHLDSLLELIEKRKSRKVLLIGLAFKEGTDDLRGSAMLELAVELLLRSYEVRIFDPEVSPESLIGANRQFAEAKLPRFESLLNAPLVESLSPGGEAMTIVVSKACVDLEVLAALLEEREGDHVVDVNGWEELSSAMSSYEGLCW